MKTTVVNIRFSECDVYIGRAGHGQDGYWGNPFSGVRDGGRNRAVSLYREYFLKRLLSDPEFARRTMELKGKRLGCFCAPKLCYGDVIVEYLEKPMKVVVCGSRHWTDRVTMWRRLSELPLDAIVVQGECEGADAMACQIALDIALEVVGFYPAWKKHGKPAGPKRNIKMLNTNPSLVLAFHDDLDKSKGTKHIVGEARDRGIKVEVINSNDL